MSTVETIGPYKVLRPIARGGMAEVYEVEDPFSNEHLAVKLLMQDGPARARFDREFEAMIRLNHPNIVRVYNYGVEGPRRWLSMELVDGTPIQAYAKHCGRPGTKERTNEVIRISHDLALALDHIHRRGLVHRDLKSANVLVLPDGRVKLLDFGTAKVSRARQQITRDGEFIGTFAYASPEQLTGKEVDHRSDLYSLGVLLYRLATGKRPFAAKELHELARQQVKQKPLPPTELISTIPISLENVILSLLEKDPAKRPESGEAVARALEEVAGSPLYLPGTLNVDLSSERLVGREQQMSSLWSFLDGGGRHERERAGPGNQPADIALIVGLRGSGRHRVLQSLERDVASRGWRSTNGFFRRGQEDLASMIEMLLALGNHFASKPPTIQSALDTLAAIQLGRVSVAEKLERMRECGQRLLAVLTRSSKNPVVLFLRGLVNAGPVGYEFVVGFRETLLESNLPVLLIGDVAERADDPNTMARKRLPDALRVYLDPMTHREVALMVGSLLHRRPPPATVARQIHDASGGLPTYVEEVVKQLVGGGILRARGHDANRIEWAKKDFTIPVPDGARLWVLDSLAELPGDRRRLLEALAVIGGEGTTRVLSAALDTPLEAMQLALGDLVTRGWIALEPEGDLVYAKWRQRLAEQIVREQLHPCRLRLLEEKIVVLVAHQPAFKAQIELLLEVGRVDEALDRALDWAVHHLSRHRPLTVLSVLDLVEPHINGASGTTNTVRSQLYLLHVTSLLMARPTDPRTARSLQQAELLGQHEGDLFHAELFLTRAQLQRVIGHYPNFRKYLMKAWNLIEHQAPSPLGATVADLLGWSNRVAGLVDDAAAWHGRSRRIAVQVGIPGVQAHADVGVAGWQYARGLLLEAERTVIGAVKVFDEYGDTRGIAMALPIWAATLRQQGRYTEVLNVLYQQTPTMRESEETSLYVRLMLAAARCELDLCRLGRAQECIEELAASLRKGEHLDLRLAAELMTGDIQEASGELNEAHLTLTQVAERATAAGLTVLAHRAKAQLGVVLWKRGDERVAKRLLTDSVSALRKAGDVPALVAAIIGQGAVMCTTLDPDRIYAPASEFIDNQPAPAAQLQRAIARLQWRMHRGLDAGEAGRTGARLLIQIRKGLSETEQAALRLHPWTWPLREAGIDALV